MPSQLQTTPVFAAPANHLHIVKGSRPVDLAKLATMTGGDRHLEEDVLHIFLKQAKSISSEMRKGCECDVLKLHAHTLKGAARAVGALHVEKSATALEENPSSKPSLKTLLSDIDTACNYINALLR